MLNFLPAVLVGAIASLLMVHQRLFWVPILLVFALIKLLVPIPAFRRAIAPVLLAIAEAWIILQQRLDGADPAHPLGRGRPGRAGLPQLVHGQLQPPVLGRHPGAAAPAQPAYPAAEVLPQAAADLGAGDGAGLVGAGLSLHAPAQRGLPAQTPRDARQGPGNHTQGLREVCTGAHQRDELSGGHALHPAKHARQQSPYQHLLKPKAGGLALALDALGDKFQAILDVTIVYPDGRPTFWHFLQGRMHRVTVRARLLPLPTHLDLSQYSSDSTVRAVFHTWVQEIWQEKDALVTQLLQEQGTPKESAAR
jgi:hypothetical protein